MRHTARWIVPVLVVLLPWALIAAAPPDDPPGKVKGEVVAVRQATQLQNQGEYTEIQVRTRNQEQLWLQLGPHAEFGDQVQVGDRVRARIQNRVGQDADGDVLAVAEMYNYRTRARIQVRNEDGELVPLQQRTRTQARYADGPEDGTGQQERNRVRTREHAGEGGGGNGGGGGGNRGGGGGGGR